MQLRGCLLKGHAPLLDAIWERLASPAPNRHDNPRNITGNPLAGSTPSRSVRHHARWQAIQDRRLRRNGPASTAHAVNVPSAGAPDSFPAVHNDLAFLAGPYAFALRSP